jgi:hypothetical protein
MAVRALRNTHNATLQLMPHFLPHTLVVRCKCDDDLRQGGVQAEAHCFAVAADDLGWDVCPFNRGGAPPRSKQENDPSHICNACQAEARELATRKYFLLLQVVFPAQGSRGIFTCIAIEGFVNSCTYQHHATKPYPRTGSQSQPPTASDQLPQHPYGPPR